MTILRTMMMAKAVASPPSPVSIKIKPRISSEHKKNICLSENNVMLLLMWPGGHQLNIGLS